MCCAQQFSSSHCPPMLSMVRLSGPFAPKAASNQNSMYWLSMEPMIAFASAAVTHRSTYKSPINTRVVTLFRVLAQAKLRRVPRPVSPFRSCFGDVSAFFCEIANVYAGCFGVRHIFQWSGRRGGVIGFHRWLPVACEAEAAMIQEFRKK